MARVQPDLPPLIHAACEILQHCEGLQMKITVLNKSLFYSDLFALLETGETITRRPFIALKAGPVLGGYERHLVRDLQRHGLATQITNGADKPIRLLAPVATALDQKTKEIVAMVAKGLRGFSANDASIYSHDNPGWIAAWRAGVGKTIDMNLAMQQIADVDLWVAQPLSKAEQEASRKVNRSRIEELRAEFVAADPRVPWDLGV